jgi:lysophospholipase L1-like esterase
MLERPGRSAFGARLASVVSGAAMTGLSVLLVLVVFEVGLRLTHAVASSEAGPDPASALFTLSHNDAVGFEHAADARVHFPEVTTDAGWNPAWRVSTDGRGLRSNGTRAGPAPEAIGICMGDSIMFGVGLDDGATIPALLSDFVSESIGHRFECLNFGVSNYTTAQEVESFRYKRALEQNPVVVVLEIFINDFKTSLGRIEVLDGRTQLVEPGTSRWLSARLSDMRLWKLAAASVTVARDGLRRHGLHPNANAKPLKAEQIAAVYAALDELRAMLEPRGIPLLVVSFPRDWQLGAADRAAASERQRVVREYCEENGVAYIDLLDHWYGQPIEAYYRPGDDSHPHAAAAQSIARVISDAVVSLIRQ